MRAALLILRKDLRLLVRTPALLLALIAYPVLVALLVALALQTGERRPDVAVVDLDASGRSVAVGDERLTVDDYIDRLDDDVDIRRMDAAQADEALDAGRVAAVLTIPEGFIADLQSGIRQPELRLRTSRRSPIEADALERNLESAVYRLNGRLAEGYVDQVLQLVDLVQNGGDLAYFGRSGDALGLRRARALVTGLQASLGEEGRGELAGRLAPVLEFIDETQENLDLARPAANAISAPIRLEVTAAPEGREPLSAFGVAAALLVSLGLAGVLLGAAATASEREEHVLTRLGRGLVSPWWLALAKMTFTALAALVIGLALLAGVALTTSLGVGRWHLWIAALVLAGLAFGAAGALVGALARETRTAVLVALMLALPLLALGLIPDADAAAAVASVVPFGPAFRAFQAILVEPSLGGDLALTLGHLALLAAVFGAAAGVALRRRVGG
ncbi:ABC transporter permease [Miltoncostaea marina]|uniref:ABC transporter permease n=1 Tax=Miltoncostaea marina TaxID=2843215 RepID=UPI001C3E4A6D|nr:ABC transporter permease [Miltoncostaea marina]